MCKNNIIVYVYNNKDIQGNKIERGLFLGQKTALKVDTNYIRNGLAAYRDKEIRQENN